MNAFGPLLRRRDERVARAAPVVLHRNVRRELRPPAHRGAGFRTLQQLQEPPVPRAAAEPQAGPPVVGHPRRGHLGVRQEEPVVSSRQVVMQQC